MSLFALNHCLPSTNRVRIMRKMIIESIRWLRRKVLSQNYLSRITDVLVVKDLAPPPGSTGSGGSGGAPAAVVALWIQRSLVSDSV